MAYKSKKLPARKKHYTKTKAEKDRDKETIRTMLGPEPDDHEIEKLDQTSRYILALDWYRQACDVKDGRTFLEDFLEEAKSKHLQAIRQVPDQWINLTACWIARLMTRGAVLPATAVPFFKKRIVEMIAKVGADDAVDADGVPIEKIKVEKPTVQENTRNKASELCAEIQGLIDDRKATNGWSAYQWLIENAVSSKVAEHILDRFMPILNELTEAMKGEDPDLIEGYRHLKKKDLKLMVEFYQALIDDTNKLAHENKVGKKPRKPRERTMAQRLKHFKYMKDCPEYNLTSISPEKIFRANELWTFNAATRILTVYKATAGDLLDVKRTAITHFEPKMSMSKRIGRDTADVLKTVLTCGKPQLPKLMASIKAGPAKFNDRLHDRVVLLRVV